MSETVSLMGGIASILGLFISILILWGLRSIRLHYLLKARIPDLIDSLSEKADQLSKYYQDFDSSIREIETNLRQCEATLKNLKIKVSGVERQAVKALLKKFKKKERPIRIDTAWDIYDDLQGLIESLKHLMRDRKWSR